MGSLAKGIVTALVVAGSSPASAALIARTFTFTASDFAYATPGVTPPFSTVSGKFTVRFDNTQSYTNATTGITINQMTLPIEPRAATFTYMPGGPGMMSIRNVRTSPFVISDQVNFDLSIFFAGGPSPVVSQFNYAAPGFNASVFVARNIRFAFEEATIAPVPEPKTWAMLLVGFGLIGSLIRHAPRGRRLELI